MIFRISPFFLIPVYPESLALQMVGLLYVCVCVQLSVKCV